WAVDCLVLARQLRAPVADRRIPQLSVPYRIESVSKLLTQLDQKPDFVRVELPEHEHEQDDDHVHPAAIYRILDRDPKQVRSAELSAENVAHIIAELIVLDRGKDDSPAKAFLSGYGHDRIARASVPFEAAAGSLATADGELKEHGFLRSEHLPLLQDWHFPDDLSRSKANDLRKSLTRHLIEEVWPNVEQEWLGGKTPLQASHSSE